MAQRVKITAMVYVSYHTDYASHSLGDSPDHSDVPQADRCAQVLTVHQCRVDAPVPAQLVQHWSTVPGCYCITKFPCPDNPPPPHPQDLAAAPLPVSMDRS